jgi:hypothetical protein
VVAETHSGLLFFAGDRSFKLEKQVPESVAAAKVV